MNDPPRLRDQSHNPLIHEMLSAAGRQEPPRRAMQSTLLAAATAAGVMGGQATAGAAIAGTTAASLTKLAAKWTLLSAVVVGGGVAGVETSGVLEDRNVANVAGASASAAAPQSAVSPRRLGAPGPVLPAPVPASEESVAAFPEVAPPSQAVVAARPPKAQPPVELRREQLEGEVALLDQARRALNQGRYGDVRRLSERYLTEYPGGRLEQEARYLRMQAARQQGDVARAQSEARALLALNPQGPHAKAAREVFAAGD